METTINKKKPYLYFDKINAHLQNLSINMNSKFIIAKYTENFIEREKWQVQVMLNHVVYEIKYLYYIFDNGIIKRLIFYDNEYKIHSPYNWFRLLALIDEYTYDYYEHGVLKLFSLKFNPPLLFNLNQIFEPYLSFTTNNIETNTNTNTNIDTESEDYIVKRLQALTYCDYKTKKIWLDKLAKLRLTEQIE